MQSQGHVSSMCASDIENKYHVYIYALNQIHII